MMNTIYFLQLKFKIFWKRKRRKKRLKREKEREKHLHVEHVANLGKATPKEDMQVMLPNDIVQSILELIKQHFVINS